VYALNEATRKGLVMHIEAVFQNLVRAGAGWIMYLLVALSVLALAVMVERLVFFLRTRVDAASLRQDLLRRLAMQEEPSTLRGRLDASRSLEARIVSAGLCSSSAAEAEERMAAEAQVQRLRSEQYLAFLGTLGNNAPFIGLLGTVIGIIGALEQLDAARGQLTNGLMTEIGEALVATAVGLLVALPAVAAYNAFQRTIQVRLNQGDVLGRELIAHLHALAHGAARGQ
jgi:biopolymer transport protein ExbB